VVAIKTGDLDLGTVANSRLMESRIHMVLQVDTQVVLVVGLLRLLPTCHNRPGFGAMFLLTAWVPRAERGLQMYQCTAVAVVAMVNKEEDAL
jgi:hypothetical protein